MEQIRPTETFCNIELFIWESWDLIDTDMFYFYNVEFCLDSMKEYNGCNVMRKFDGTMEIYSKDGKDVVWNGTIVDIPEVAEKLILNKSKSKCDSRFVEYLKKTFLKDFE